MDGESVSAWHPVALLAPRKQKERAPSMARHASSETANPQHEDVGTVGILSWHPVWTSPFSMEMSSLRQVPVSDYSQLPGWKLCVSAVFGLMGQAWVCGVLYVLCDHDCSSLDVVLLHNKLLHAYKPWQHSSLHDMVVVCAHGRERVKLKYNLMLSSWCEPCTENMFGHK